MKKFGKKVFFALALGAVLSFGISGDVRGMKKQKLSSLWEYLPLELKGEIRDFYMDYRNVFHLSESAVTLGSVNKEMYEQVGRDSSNMGTIQKLMKNLGELHNLLSFDASHPCSESFLGKANLLFFL